MPMCLPRVNLPGKIAITKNRIPNRQRHADDPPDQPDFQPVVGGFGICDCQIIGNPGGGRQHVRVEVNVTLVNIPMIYAADAAKAAASSLRAQE